MASRGSESESGAGFTLFGDLLCPWSPFSNLRDFMLVSGLRADDRVRLLDDRLLR